MIIGVIGSAIDPTIRNASPVLKLATANTQEFRFGNPDPLQRIAQRRQVPSPTPIDGIFGDSDKGYRKDVFRKSAVIGSEYASRDPPSVSTADDDNSALALNIAKLPRAGVNPQCVCNPQTTQGELPSIRPQKRNDPGVRRTPGS